MYILHYILCRMYIHEYNYIILNNIQDNCLKQCLSIIIEFLINTLAYLIIALVLDNISVCFTALLHTDT